MNADPLLEVLIIITIAALLMIAALTLKEIKHNPIFYGVTTVIFIATAYLLYDGLAHQCANEIIFRRC